MTRFCRKTCIRCVSLVGQDAGASAPCARFASVTFLSQQRQRQDIGGRDGVLNREIDADAADRRHGVGRIADAEQPGPVPLLQTVDLDRQQLHVVPGFESRARVRQGTASRP